ncbi:hypothetical protein P7K49_002340 [Saguinus oedipus]|uniref:Uncharacterized protein n=1 Tax=Saguinus oedipus TaxID=9490 RepID=A0ABQ9WJ46_SAGOE|nr:hypothetical protein P7K49_002340 [Saguinus oedipus]
MEAERGPERPPTERSSPGPTPEEGARSLAEFAALHGPALRASGVPERYWGGLLHKLEHEVRGRAAGTCGGRGQERALQGGGSLAEPPLPRPGQFWSGVELGTEE